MSELTTKLKLLRKYKMIENIIWVVGFVLIFCASQLLPNSIVGLLSFIFFIAIGASTAFVMSQKCPKCSNYFHGSNPIWGNTLRRSCAHCGLHVNGNNS